MTTADDDRRTVEGYPSFSRADERSAEASARRAARSDRSRTGPQRLQDWKADHPRLVKVMAVGGVLLGLNLFFAAWTKVIHPGDHKSPTTNTTTPWDETTTTTAPPVTTTPTVGGAVIGMPETEWAGHEPSSGALVGATESDIFTVDSASLNRVNEWETNNVFSDDPYVGYERLFEVPEETSDLYKVPVSPYQMLRWYGGGVYRIHVDSVDMIAPTEITASGPWTQRDVGALAASVEFVGTDDNSRIVGVVDDGTRLRRQPGSLGYQADMYQSVWPSGTVLQPGKDYVVVGSVKNDVLHINPVLTGEVIDEKVSFSETSPEFLRKDSRTYSADQLVDAYQSCWTCMTAPKAGRDCGVELG